MAGPSGVGHRLPPFFAVVTLPLGILAFMFSGLEAAAVVFVVGWLLLVPATAVLTGPPGPGDLEAVAEMQQAADRIDAGGAGDGDAGADPVEKLRDRYASGEIDEREFERRLEALLETEDLDPTDEAAVERAIRRLDEVEDERVRDDAVGESESLEDDAVEESENGQDDAGEGERSADREREPE